MFIRFKRPHLSPQKDAATSNARGARPAAEPASGTLIGRDFGDRYRIEAEIGHGGIGVVYRAVNHKLERAVALKLLRSEAIAPSQRLRFEREAKALAALRHPNIVTVLDCGVSESVPYLVMELLEGQSLAEALAAQSFPLARAERVIRELLSALSYVHACGLVHRDLKPANVFLQRLPDGGEQVKLLDFGLAKFLDHEHQGDATTLTRSGEVFGTPGYMPPEQWSGQAVDARADVYGAAVVCVEMLAGRKPFAGEGQELLRRQLIEAAPLLHEICPESVACPELERLLQRALARQARDRQRDGSALLAELESVPRPWVYSGAEATPERRNAALAVREALDIATAPTLEQRAPIPGSPAALAPASARRTEARPGLPGRALHAIAELLRRLVLASAWTLSIVSVFAIGLAAAVIYIMTSPDHGKQRAALEQALPPLRDAVMRGAAAATSAVHDAVSDRADPAPARVQPEREPQSDAEQPVSREQAHDPWGGSISQELRELRSRVDAGQRGDERMLDALRRYGREHPQDPRAHLLLARLFRNRDAWTEATAQYRLAFACDSSSRNDPWMLQDLIRAVGHEVSSASASELVRSIYGRGALGAIARARSHAHSAQERERLDRLARTLSP